MSKITINWKLSFLMIAYFILLQPEYLTLNSMLNKAFLLSKCVVCVIVLVLYLYSNTISFSQILIVAFQGSLIFSTLLKATEVKYVCKVSVFLIGFSMLTEMAFRYYKKYAVCAFYYVTFFYVFINFVSVILCPEGLWTSGDGTQPHWFLGQKNILIMMIIPSLTAGLIMLWEKNKRISPMYVFHVVIATLSILLTDSATSVGVLLLFLFFYFLYLIRMNYVQIFNSLNFVWIIFLCNIFVLFAKYISVIAWLITSVLKRNLSFSGRVTIWNHAYEWILKSPVFGWGYEKTDVIITKLGGNPNFLSCHNYFLNVVYKQGIIGLVFLFLVIGIVVKKMYKFRENGTSQIISIAILVMLIDGIFEALGWSEPFFWLLLVGLYYDLPKKLIQGKEK